MTPSQIKAIAHRIEVAAKELEPTMPGRARRMMLDAKLLRDSLKT